MVKYTCGMKERRQQNDTKANNRILPMATAYNLNTKVLRSIKTQ